MLQAVLPGYVAARPERGRLQVAGIVRRAVRRHIGAVEAGVVVAKGVDRRLRRVEVRAEQRLAGMRSLVAPTLHRIKARCSAILGET